jgi:hypothetical protein
MKHYLIVTEDSAMRMARELAELTGATVADATASALASALSTARERRRATQDRAVLRAIDPCYRGPSSALLARP